MLVTNHKPASNTPYSIPSNIPKDKTNIFKTISDTQTNEKTTTKQCNFTVKKEGFDEGCLSCLQCICCFFSLACEGPNFRGGYRPVRGGW